MPDMPNRHRNHQLETESRKAFESVIPSTWVVRHISDDYGNDLEVEIFDDQGNATAEKIYVQIKSTDSADLKSILKESGFKISTYNYLMKQRYPVLVAKFSAKRNIIYYRWIFEKLETPIQEGANSLTLHFNELKIFNKEAISTVIMDMRNFLKIKGRFNFNYFCYKIENIDSKISIVNIKQALQLSKTLSKELIKFKNEDYDGNIYLHKDYCKIIHGGGVNSFVFHCQEDENPEDILKQIFFSTAVLLDHSMNQALSSRLFKQSFKVKSFYIQPDFQILVLKSFYDANMFSELKDAYSWFLKENELVQGCNRFLSMLMRSKFHGSSVEERNLFESLFKMDISFFKERGSTLNLAASTYSLGRYYMSINKDSTAISYLNNARKLDPTYLKRKYFWQEIGTILYNKRNLKWAKECYAKALTLEEAAILHAFLGDCELYGYNLEKANIHYKKAMEISINEEIPSHYSLLNICIKYLLENFHLEKGKFKYKNLSGINDPEELSFIEDLEENILYSDKWFDLGLIYLKREESEKASFAFTIAALICQSDIEAWTNAFFSNHNWCLKAKTEGEKWQSNIFGATIFQSAYERNKTKFLEWILERVQRDIPKEHQEELREMILQMADSIKVRHEFTLRIIDQDKKYKELKI